MRFLLVALVALTLNQPEWLEFFKPEQDPTLAVVWDDSGSMATRDVIDEQRPAAAPVARSAWLQPYLDPAVWQVVAEKVDVVFEPFSAAVELEQPGTDVHAALAAVTDKYDNLRGVVLFSDGDWNAGKSPVSAATRLRMQGVPVFTVGVGRVTHLPDVEVLAFDPPAYAIVGKTTRIPFSVRSWLPRDIETVVTLSCSNGEEVSESFRVPAMGRLDDVVAWQPEDKGEFTLTLTVPQHESETIAQNNSRTQEMEVRAESLQVLLVESFPRWEYRYFRNALERDPGVEVACLLFHPDLNKVGGGRGYLKAFPDTLEKLGEYDVVFLGDVGVGNGQLTVEQCKLLKGLVQSQASGVILMPGMRGNHFSLLDTELGDLYPVVLDAAQVRGWGSRLPAQFELTESGRASLLTKLAETEDATAAVWESLPGFQWYAPVVRAKAGSEVLAVHKIDTNRFGRIPLLVTKTYGTGKILFMGTDGAWRWREGVEDKYHYRFWGQVARWMAYQRNLLDEKWFYSPERPAAGDTVTVNANMMGPSGEPLVDGNVVVEVVAPSGQSELVRLTSQPDGWGLFTGRFTPQEHGDHMMTLTCRENGQRLETTLSVQGVEREQVGQPARHDVLAEIASITRGETVDPGNIAGLLDKIAALPEPEPLVRRVRIWCHPAWAGFLVVLLGLFWTGRKLAGSV